jgi:hypothetical protein
MSRFTFPRNLSDQRAMVRFSIHERANQLDSIGVREMHSTQKVLSRIYLYMPQSIQINDGLTFETVDLANLIGLGTDLVNAASNGITGNDAASRANLDAASTHVLTQMSGSGGLASGAASQALIQKGRVLNPRTQMLFKGPVIRQFSFSFKLIPSNKDEADDIYEMIKTIRLNSYPDTAGIDGSEGVFTFPNIFRIEMLSNPSSAEFTSANNADQLKMIRLADTYCTAISTNYNPTSPTFFAGGYPSEIDIGLTFQETRTINRKDIEENGY